jgi:hypothetical protein
MSKLSSGQNFTKRKNATPTGSYPQKQTTISSTKLKDSARVEMSGFKQLPRKMAFGRIFTAAKLKESIEETAGGIKHDMEANRTDIEEASNVTPAEITVKRSNLNELLAQRLRDEIGVDCQAPEIGSVEIEHKHYYSYNIPMSPKITTNRGCIIVSGRSFSLIQIIQRN